MYAQVGDCLIDLIDGSESLPYVEDPRYSRRRKMIEGLVPNDVNAEIALHEKYKADVLHRKCSEFPLINHLYRLLMIRSNNSVQGISTTRIGSCLPGVYSRTTKTSHLSSGNRRECDYCNL